MISTNFSANFTKAAWEESIKEETNLKLSNQGLVDENITALAEVLKENTNIRAIDLSKNKFTTHGAKALADALYINTTFAANPIADTHVFKVSDNNIGKEGVESLVKAFHDTDRMIHCIIFGDNGLTDKELEEISVTPELIEICKRSEEFRKALYPSGDCVIS